MKIPDAEMPKRYTFDQTGCCDGAIEERPNGEWVSFSAYQRLYNERRFIPVEECSPWISVEDRLPEEGSEVLFVSVGSGGDKHVSIGSRNPAFTMGKRLTPYWWDNVDECYVEPEEVTHWMPLPAPPETE